MCTGNPLTVTMRRKIANTQGITQVPMHLQDPNLPQANTAGTSHFSRQETKFGKFQYDTIWVMSEFGPSLVRATSVWILLSTRDFS